jgi:hypothetical protein
MIVLVAGAHGRLGSRVVALLLRRGHVVRTDVQAAVLRHAGAEAVVADLSRHGALTARLAATALQRRSDPAGRDGPRRGDALRPGSAANPLAERDRAWEAGGGTDPRFPAPGFESPWRYL